MQYLATVSVSGPSHGFHISKVTFINMLKEFDIFKQIIEDFPNYCEEKGFVQDNFLISGEARGVFLYLFTLDKCINFGGNSGSCYCL